MVDYTFYETLVTAAVTIFFVVLASIMLVRYRRLAQRLSASSDVGEGLYESLESRLKKQDERILDVMTRLDVLQAKALEAGKRPEHYFWSVPPVMSQPQTPAARDRSQEYRNENERVIRQPPSSSNLSTPAGTMTSQKPETPHPVSAGDMIYASLREVSKQPDSGEVRALRLLSEAPRTSVEIRDVTGLSREHAARIMKGLYDKGFVVRDDSHKPYHYELTDEGRRHLSSN